MAEKKNVFGIYQRETGSFTYGATKFVPGKAVEIPAETAAKLDASTAPVRFVNTPAQADEEIARVKKLFAKPERKK